MGWMEAHAHSRYYQAEVNFSNPEGILFKDNREQCVYQSIQRLFKNVRNKQTTHIAQNDISLWSVLNGGTGKLSRHIIYAKIEARTSRKL